ncbi:MAG: hypothetical protein HOC77_11110 [Chloroflexi bacterium]|jgi:DNA repair protein SbcD/Mre11|nr:hypothetical protein [Chloroflexota bacterium]MBT4073139.1 hypothetical protein [Chloroflexota bacterium]MBT4515625.1 hypothetical protein [Chloroflexota bacterium]MBT5318533.1 hypothetical protein [Chloroflexota bacterium]MBT6680538.1 hypothetical protein [Chloroflexota bacterium]
MRPIKFIHAAGLRLDSPYSGLRHPSAVVDERLRSATFDAFRNLQALCVTESPDFLLIAGGIFELQDRSARAQLAFRDGLATIVSGGTQVFLAFGPDDPAAAWLPTINWPDDVHVLGGKPDWHAIVKDDETAALLQGASHQSSTLPGSPASDFLTPPSSEVFSVSTANQIPALDEDGSDSLDSLPGAHYWALGPAREGSIPSDPSRRVLTIGPSQGLSPSETGPHGCFVVQTDEAGRAGPRFVALDTVRWEKLTLDVSQMEPEGLTTAARESVLNALGSAEGRDLVCRLTLTGTPLGHPISVDQLLGELREAVQFEQPWVWVDRIENLTEPAPQVVGGATDADPETHKDAGTAPLLATLNTRYNSVIHDGALGELIKMASPEDHDPDEDRDRILIARDALALATQHLANSKAGQS